MAKQPLAIAKDPPICFTDAAVKKLGPDPARRREIRDQLTQGLVLRITPQGQKSWSVLYRIAGEGEDGKRGPLKRVTLGEYPLIGLADARARALQVLEIADTGQEPGATRERASAPAIRGQTQAKQDERLVRHVVERFATVYARPNLVNAREIERLLQTYVVTAWGDRRIDTITRADVHNLIDQFVAEGEISRGREVRKHLTRVFNWAVDRDIIRANPLSGMERPEIAYKPRERTLTMAEMRAIWQATPAMGYPFGPIVRMLILSGQRKSEIAEARWS